MLPVDLTALVPLPAEFFARDPREVAHDLLGTLLVSRAGGMSAGGRVVEVEAYLGPEDPGSHASTKGITRRNAVMYGPPSSVYVYFTYGNHYMVNLVCGPEGRAGAVLVRALEPLIGVAEMERRRGSRPIPRLANGPGKLAQALGIDLSDNGVRLGEGRLVVYDSPRPRPEEIAVSGRVGLSAGHELQLRFFVKDSPFVSRGRIGPSSRSSRRKTGTTEGQARETR